MEYEAHPAQLRSSFVSQPLPNNPPVPRPRPQRPGRQQERLAALGPERARFRELIARVGSGEHTSTGLSRQEACEAMDLMLAGRVSEAQLGAFLIAHRIRRPQPLELTGMLDSYRNHGPVLKTPGRRALCFGVPYDGRSCTAGIRCR